MKDLIRYDTDREIHILLIWSKALHEKDFILDDLKKTFHIVRTFFVKWEKYLFNENLKRFYSHSQQKLNVKELEELLQYKKEHCGDDPFFVIILEDKQPKYDYRETSSGFVKLNTNIFDKKEAYRKKLGGGHQIHTSNNLFECNKDVTLLFGLNINDFLKQYPGYDESPIRYEKSILGAEGWNNISDFFYVLNNTIDYVVLRNYECFPEDYNMDDHGDIDLLVENLNYIRYLTGATPVFPKPHYRVHFSIFIGSEKVLFDFRYIGDSYYDIQWEHAILQTRKLFKDFAYVPDDENYFYSLMYHAFVHKKKVSNDYHEKLLALAPKIGKQYDKEFSLQKMNELLSSFMQSKGYHYNEPVDETVYYNKEFINAAALVQSFSHKLSSTINSVDDKIYLTDVFKHNRQIVKIATNPIAFYENKFLGQLKEHSNFPKLLSMKEGNDFSEVTISYVNHLAFEDIAKSIQFWNKKKFIGFIDSCLFILLKLAEKNILHRDIRPGNILVRKEDKYFIPVLIDFGWATPVSDASNALFPEGLGSKYRFSRHRFSDAHSMGKIFKEHFNNFRFLQSTIKGLIDITADDYNEPDRLKEKLQKVRANFSASAANIPLKDRVLFAYKRIKILVRLAKKVLARLKNYASRLKRALSK